MAEFNDNVPLDIEEQESENREHRQANETSPENDSNDSMSGNDSPPLRRPRMSSPMNRMFEEVQDLVDVQLNSMLEELNTRLSDVGGQIKEYFGEFNSRLENIESRVSTIEKDVKSLKDKQVSYCDRVRNTDSITANTHTVQQNQNITCNNVSQAATESDIDIVSVNKNANVKIKPQKYDGTEDLDEYLAQFNITSEINGWNGKTKALYLASSLSGTARGLLSELSETQQRDFPCLVSVLNTRFGSMNRAEIYRSELKTRVRKERETIPELAQNIKKLTRQAYPGATSGVIDTLALDYFMDAIQDPEIRLRLRELSPANINEAERIAVKMEAHRIADKQRGTVNGSCLGVNTGSGIQDRNVENQMEKIYQSVDTLTRDMRKLKAARYHENDRNYSIPYQAHSFQSVQNGGNSGIYQKHQREGNPPHRYQARVDNSRMRGDNQIQRPKQRGEENFNQSNVRKGSQNYRDARGDNPNSRGGNWQRNSQWNGQNWGQRNAQENGRRSGLRTEIRQGNLGPNQYQ